MAKRIRAALVGGVAGATLLSASPAPAGDPVRGERVFQQCQSCHMVGPEAVHATGPSLNGLFGRRAGTAEGFAYSDDMRRAGASGLVWDAGHLDVYLANPRSLATGTRMGFPGIESATDRGDLIAYLRGFSASPRDIPEAEPTAEPVDPDLAPEILALKGDPAYGEYLAGECVTCHQANGAYDGIPPITGWPERDFVTALHAYKQGYRPHPVMQMIARRLSDDEIASLAAFFAGLE